MATVSFTIHSHYDPKERERLEIETGQIPNNAAGTSNSPRGPQDLEPEALWRKEASQIYKRPSLASSAPRFVPAKVVDGDWAGYVASAPTLASKLKGEKKSDVAGWYRSLTGSSNATSPSPSPAPGASPSQIERPSSAPIPGSTATIATSGPPNHQHKLAPVLQKKIDKNNWFIQNVITATTDNSNASTSGTRRPDHTPFSIGAEPIASSSTTPAPPPTLTDILVRDPPPTSKEGRFKPPIWVALGPGNKGFGMLQKTGWREGEALGPYALRRKGKEKEEVDVSALLGDFDEPGSDVERRRRKGKGKADSVTKVEYVEVTPSGSKRRRVGKDDAAGDDDAVTELKKAEVVDLTLDSEESETEYQAGASCPKSVDQGSSGANVKVEDEVSEDSEAEETTDDEDREDDAEAHPGGHGGTALLTPISTILKTDRLGIGLKPKLASSAGTKDAYRVPLLKDTRRNQVRSSKGFRVTSTQGVLDEIRRREQEEKRDREIWGRGKKGRERKRRKEEADRKGLLAYMNS